MKLVKKLVMTVVILFVLLLGGLFALVKMAPVERIEAEVIAQVKAKTGRDLSFTDAKMTIWPSIGLRLSNVALGNAEWASDKNMVTLEEAEIRLALRPLLQKRVEVERFLLKKPEIFLELAADGRQSWEMKGAEPAAAPADETAEKSGGNAVGDIDFSLGDFEISRGRLSYNDKKAGKVTLVENINVSVTFPDLDSALQLDGALEYLGKRVQLVLALDKPVALADGKTSPGSLRVKTDDFSANVSGVFATSGTMLKDGSVEADVASLSKLVAWVTGAAAEPLPFEKIAFASKADASAEKLALKGAALKLDDIEASGDVTLNLAGARPDIFARLKIGKIDLDRFVKGDSTAASQPQADKPKGNDGWDATPIDFSGLKAVDADVVLETQGFSLKGADVGASTLTTALKNGNLKASSSPASLFDGRFSSEVGVNASGAVPALSFTFDMKDVQAQPVLKTFADFNKLTGTVDADISVTASGNSQKAIVSALNGKGAVVFRNGAITGIDLVNIAQAVQRGLASFNVGEGKTEFVDLGGTFTIAGGIVKNDDLRLRGPLLQATGAGDVNLPARTVKYRVVPTLTASSGTDNAKGLSIPVDISGPFGNLSIRPDLQAAVQNVLDNPDAINDTLKNVKQQGKAIEGNFKDLKKDLKSDPGKALQNLLGGGFGAAAPAAETPAATPAEAAPAAVPAAPAPAETAPVDATPAESAPVEAAPAEPAPAAESAP